MLRYSLQLAERRLYTGNKRDRSVRWADDVTATDDSNLY